MSTSQQDILKNYDELSLALWVNFDNVTMELINTTNAGFNYKVGTESTLQVSGTSILFGSLRTSSVKSVSCKGDILEVHTMNSIYTFRVPKANSKYFYWEAKKDVQEALHTIALSTFLS